MTPASLKFKSCEFLEPVSIRTEDLLTAVSCAVARLIDVTVNFDIDVIVDAIVDVDVDVVEV